MNDVVSANALKTRVRLRESSNIYAVAVLSNGDIVAGERFVKVTIGGCGGGGTSDAISRAERVCSPEKVIKRKSEEIREEMCIYARNGHREVPVPSKIFLTPISLILNSEH